MKAARAAASRSSACPTSCRSSPSPSTRSPAWSTSSTRCCSARSPPPSACSASCWASAASTRSTARSPTLVGGPRWSSTAAASCRPRRSFRREPTPEVATALAQELRERARRGDGPSSRPPTPTCAARARAPGGRRRASAPADGGALPQAWLVAASDTGGLAEIDRLILHQAVTVVALELLRRRVADSTERRLAGDVLTGDDRRRARRGRAGAPARSVRPRRPRRRDRPEPRPDRVTPGACETALADALRAEAVDGLVAASGARRAGAPAGVPDDELFEIAERVWARATRAGAPRHPPGPGARSPAGDALAGVPRGALRARGARSWARENADERRHRRQRPAPTGRSRPTATSAPSSCCSPSRTPTPCGCSATRCFSRSRAARVTTAAS